MSKVCLCDLMDTDLKRIYDQNNAIQAEVVADYDDMIRDIISGERKHIFNCANIARDGQNNFTVNVAPENYLLFIDALADPRSQFGYDVLSDPHMRIIYEYMDSRRGAYIQAREKDDNENQLIACFNTGIRLLCDALENALAAFCDEINDSEKLYNFFIDNYATDEYYIRPDDLGTVYKTVTKIYK